MRTFPNRPTSVWMREFSTFLLLHEGDLKVHQLYPLSHEIVHASQDVVFLEIDTNDLTTNGAVEVGDNVLAFANYLTVMGDVRKVVISQMYFRDANTSAYYVDGDFNNRVFQYNQYMHAATKSFPNIAFWSHRGIWADWTKYLADGVHFNAEGNRKYFNSVRGAVVAAVNQLITSE